MGGLGQFGDAPRVAPAVEFGGEEGAQAILGDLGSHYAGAERQHIGVVVLPRQAGGGSVMADARAHPAMPVGRDRNAEAGSADEHAALCLAALYCAGDGVGEVGIIHGIPTVSPEIQHLEPQGLELGNEESFQIVAGVIGSDCDRLDHGTR